MRKALKVFMVGLGVLLVMAIALQIVGSAYVKPLIGRRLEKLVRDGSDSLYRLQYRSMSVNLWTGSVSIQDVDIFTDSVRFRTLKSDNGLPAVSTKLSLGKGDIGGFNIFKFLFRREIDINRIVTQDADISLYRHLEPDESSPKIRQTPPLWKLIRPNIRRIHVNEIIFDNIKLSYHNRDSGMAFQWKFRQFDTKLSDIMIDSASSMDQNRLLYMGNIETHIQGISLFSRDSLYGMQIGDITYSMKKRLAEIKDLKFGPTVSRKAFYRKTGVEKDIYTLDMPEIKLIRFKPELFLTENTLWTDTLFLSRGKLHIYHDRLPPDDPVSKLGKFPHQMLLKSPFHIRIKKALGDDISVTYAERDSKTMKEASLRFSRITGDASHISNHPDDIAQNPTCRVKVDGKLMGNIRIQGRFLFDLSKDDGSFEAEAHISPADVRILNPVTEALASARFKSLQTGRTYYRIKGNEREAYGYLSMPYRDLRLEVLHLPEPGKASRHKRMQSWAIKTFSHSANPGKDGILRIASNIKVERNIHRSFFNLIWKTLLQAGRDVAMKESGKKIYKKRQERKQAKENKQALAKN